MHTTIVELEFVDLPHLPPDVVGSVTTGALGNGYLLIMRDHTARLAIWNSAASQFADAAGLLDSASIRSWARLLKPVDALSWSH
ncbi:hypothetical protein XAC3562_1200033 [Xanthomonas citri pv. citri]|uniref:Uncharacterized protein n=2 Tax=Xanthomonas TaxID=338 RepID=A0A836P471_XANVA|nr:hypothetical protein B7L65_24840 [Xanthomonas citri pv. citri]CEE62015.1 hypothetical protein XAC3608_1970029 [Xanthomonas citri pv. citri]CEG14711.1 hypothetical protein XAC3562_1200033 [Xanthomonas citri pv. citri]